MHILKLTRPLGDPVWLNAGLVVSWQREPGHRTQIETGFDRYVTVRETPEQICELLDIKPASMWPAARQMDDDDDLVGEIVSAAER
jgi:hypothetical protein